ncbi:MFS transporter [Pasteurellaceae bacterium TAE3-ERU1]|nr:MFS transporter [Pasteurellaceae bacterium TAE3-ERU1]
MTTHKPQRQFSTLFFAMAVFFLALNLRPAIIAMGPVVDIVQRSLNTSATMMGVVGTLPVLAFAIFSPFVARLAKRFGAENVIITGMIGIALGCALRSAFNNIWTVLLGTFVFCGGIAMGNVLLSSMIRRYRPRYVERLTALQMLSFSVGSAVASSISVPLAEAFSWQLSLGLWGVVVIPGIIIWWRLRQKVSTPKADAPHFNTATWQGNIWKSPLAWKISIYMGLQSMMFYTMANWLPSLIAARGFSSVEAGNYSTIFQFIAFPTALLLAPLAEKVNIRILITGACLFTLAGFLLLCFASVQWMWLATALLGIGGCASFTLCLMLFALKAESAAHSAALSGMAQTVGYLIASFGPISVGYLYQLNNDWALPIYAIIGALGLQFIASLVVGHESHTR